MDPEVADLTLRLSEVAVRNTAGIVSDRIRAAKAQRKDRSTIAEMEEIIASLIADKNEVIQIAQALDEKFVAQHISADEISHVTGTLVPLVEQVIDVAGGADELTTEETIEILKPLLSAETLTVLQVLGFNFKQAIGEPLTTLLRGLILKQVPQADAEELRQKQMLETMRLAQDPTAVARFRRLWGLPPDDDDEA